jgi:hypothetical protein
MAAEHQVMRATSLVAACAPTQPALIGPAPPTFLVIRHPPSAPARPGAGRGEPRSPPRRAGVAQHRSGSYRLIRPASADYFRSIHEHLHKGKRLIT